MSGIKFPATQVPDANVNTLDDYEEGTWTPTDVSGAGLTFSGVNATYTKVGRLVTCFLIITFPTTASGAALQIGGLPYVAGNYGNMSIAGYIVATTSTIAYGGVYNVAGTSSFFIDKNNATTTAMNSDFSGKVLYVVIMYQV